MFCDLHADTPTRLFTRHIGLNAPNSGINLSAVKALNAPLVQIFAIWHDPKHPNNSDAVLDYFLQVLSKQDVFHLSVNGEDLKNKVQDGQWVALLSIEGGDMLQRNPDRLYEYYKKGVRFLTLVWNGKNDLAGGHDTDGDLTPLGREVLNRMFQLNMIPDLSHCNEKSFWSIANYGKRLFCSHSNAREICDHTRNLTDEQIRAIIDSDGLIGLNVYPPFVNGSEQGNLTDLLPHIEHICSLGGAEHLAIGSDLDGIDRPLSGCEDSRFFLSLSPILEQRGFSESVIKGLLGGNFLDKFCNF